MKDARAQGIVQASIQVPESHRDRAGIVRVIFLQGGSLHDAGEMRNKDVGDAGTVGYPPRNVTGVGWNGQK